MKRLTKRLIHLSHGEEVVNCNHDSEECNDSCMKIQRCKWYEKAMKSLKKYEDLEEKGLLVKLPFPIETKKVFYVCDDDVLELNAKEITISKTDISDIIIYTIDGYDFCYADFGKIVFLTEKEALAKLH